MEKFSTLTGTAAHMPITNIDTDMIIPKQFLKTIKRSGLGRHLFAEQRYDDAGTPIADFALNAKPDSVMIIAGENFGCGSSREHAPWALLDFGIRAVIAPSFADIFYSNCFKNGILPLVLSQDKIDAIISAGDDQVSIDLPKQTVSVGAQKFAFEIEPFRKEILIEGLDDIAQTMKHADKIEAFEDTYFDKYPWLKGVA